MAAKNSSVIIATRIVFYGAGIKSWLVACLEPTEPYLLNKEPTKELSVCYHKDFKRKTIVQPWGQYTRTTNTPCFQWTNAQCVWNGESCSTSANPVQEHSQKASKKLAVSSIFFPVLNFPCLTIWSSRPPEHCAAPNHQHHWFVMICQLVRAEVPWGRDLLVKTLITREARKENKCFNAGLWGSFFVEPILIYTFWVVVTQWPLS